MAKNIVICCDGTANEFARDNTNVVKLYSTLRHDDRASARTTILVSARWSRPVP